MELYKVFVEEKPLESSNDLQIHTPSEEVTFTVHEPLEKKDAIYLMHEYTRKAGLLRIGVKEETAASVTVQMDQSTIHLTRSLSDPSFWYDSMISWKDGWFFKQQEAYFGVNASGEATVQSFDDEGRLIDMKKILVMPSTFSYEQYEMMKMEVKSYLENISSATISADKSEIVKGVQLPLYPMKKMESFVHRLVESVKDVCENPAERLLQQKKKVRQSEVKKWNGHLLIERMIKGPYQKLSVKSTERNYDLPEHQMIKDFLASVQSRVFQERTVEQAVLNQLKNEVDGRKEKLNDQLIGREQELRIHIQNRIESLEDSIRIMGERIKKWTYFEEKIKGVLVDSLFVSLSVPMQYTHLFGYDPTYQRVFKLYEESEELVPTLEQVEWNFINSVLNSPNLYQIWVLIQLIYEVERYRYKPKESIWSSLKNCHKEKGDLIDWTCAFESEDGGEIVLGYEREVPSVDGKMLRPDYLIAYRDQRSRAWDLHILDAKYKPYSFMKNGQPLLKKDVKHSAERYLKNLRLNNVSVNRSATLIHIDPNISHWNLPGDRTYEVSHFHLLPGNLENLKTYMKRFFHFFNEQRDSCPTCGQRTPNISQIHWKETYICEADDEVWVKSTCNHCGRYSQIQLMKYASENYNEQVNAEWNVHCPNCNKEYHGLEIELDSFGRTM